MFEVITCVSLRVYPCSSQTCVFGSFIMFITNQGTHLYTSVVQSVVLVQKSCSFPRLQLSSVRQTGATRSGVFRDAGSSTRPSSATDHTTTSDCF